MSHSKIQKIKCDNFLYISSSPNKPSLCYLSQLPRQCYRHATAYAAQSHSCPVAPKEKTDSENKSPSQRYLKCLTNAQNKRKAVNKLHAHILMWLPWRSVGWSPVQSFSECLVIFDFSGREKCGAVGNFRRRINRGRLTCIRPTLVCCSDDAWVVDCVPR